MIFPTPALSALLSTPVSTSKDPIPMNEALNNRTNLDAHFGTAVDLTATAFPTVATVEPAASGHDEFFARDLPNVLDRVETPVLVMVNDNDVLHVHSADRRWSGSVVEVTLHGSDVEVVLDAFDRVEFFGPPTVLDADDDVVAYMAEGELLCARHGAPMDIGVDDGPVSPILRDDGSNLDAVEWCSHHWSHSEHGHSFCGTCGEDLQTMPGAHDREVEGPFARCSNCDTSSVYVDGDGFHFVNGFGEATESHAVEVKGVTVTYVTDLNGFTKVDRVDADNVPWGPIRTLRAYVAWVDLDPSAGVTLILCESDDEAIETADDHFERVDDLGSYPEDEREGVQADQRASIRVERVPVDAVTFTSKR